jgi:hypothetical protein
VEIEKPAAARMYDYYLGGSHNFAADRELAEVVLRSWPDMPHLCRANRAFLRRAVGLLAGLGVDQFLDLGSGIPTVGNVHEVATSINPSARTVYVDCDAVAYAHSRALLREQPSAAAIHADLRDPQAVVAIAGQTGLLDFSRPVAVLMLLALPFVLDTDGPEQIVAAYREASAPGSYLVLSHGTEDYRPQEAHTAAEVYRDRASQRVTLRSKSRVAKFLEGYDLLEPGLVDLTSWRPERLEIPDPLGGDIARYSMYAAVGRR